MHQAIKYRNQLKRNRNYSLNLKIKVKIPIAIDKSFTIKAPFIGLNKKINRLSQSLQGWRCQNQGVIINKLQIEMKV